VADLGEGVFAATGEVDRTPKDEIDRSALRASGAVSSVTDLRKGTGLIPRKQTQSGIRSPEGNVSGDRATRGVSTVADLSIICARDDCGVRSGYGDLRTQGVDGDVADLRTRGTGAAVPDLGESRTLAGRARAGKDRDVAGGIQPDVAGERSRSGTHSAMTKLGRGRFVRATLQRHTGGLAKDDIASAVTRGRNNSAVTDLGIIIEAVTGRDGESTSATDRCSETAVGERIVVDEEVAGVSPRALESAVADLGD